MSTKSKVTNKSTTGDGYCAVKTKPYNRYNLFFILERELILQQNNPTYDPFETLRAPDFVTGFEGIVMPSELPKRYSKLVLPPGWYLPGRNKRRSHKKSHGLMAFADLSKSVAQNYRTIDKETFSFLEAVANSLRKRSREIKARGQLVYLPRNILVPSSSSISESISPLSVAATHLLDHIGQKSVPPPPPLRREMKTTPPQPVEDFRQVSNFDEITSNASMTAESRPVGTMQVDPRIVEAMMLPADRPRSFIMTCVPCREDSETSAGSLSSASSACSGSSSSSSSPVSLEDLSTSADVSDHDIIRMWMSA